MTLPSKKDIIEYMTGSPELLRVKDIARAFSVPDHEVSALRQLLNDMAREGSLERQPDKSYGLSTRLPPVTVLEISHRGVDGEVYARPAEWDEAQRGAPPVIEITPDKGIAPNVRPGDRVLCQLTQIGEIYNARIMRKLDAPQESMVGKIVRGMKGLELKSVDKREHEHYIVAHADIKGAREGDIVRAQIIGGRRQGQQRARVLDILGHQNDPKAISLISIHEAGLRAEFPQAVIDETKNMTVPALGNRDDLRSLPLVTIDGADARDFDDAVFAEPTKDGGFHLVVAIADVAYYVRPGSPLDEEAYERGNSTYFPDRVVPMLPERLSNDLCSLRPQEDRACMAVHLWIDADGRLTRHKFVRGLMKSVARLTYEQVQAARDGSPDALTQPLLKTIIAPLYEAFDLLWKARARRGVLDLDMPERKVLINDKGEMTGVTKRERLDSHKLIEEFMIMANVAAATALEEKQKPCVYRVHGQPDPQRIDSLREFVSAFGLSVPRGAITEPRQLGDVLKKASTLPYSQLISEVMLRSQRQAIYATENEGHFGLALAKYAHFTSPIRRYADLLIHRSLIEAFGLGAGGLTEGEPMASLDEMAAHISQTERTSAEAERSSIDRFAAAYLSERIGETFKGRIRGIAGAGLFVELLETGADIFVPRRVLPDDYYIHDERQHALTGRRSGRVYRLGATVDLRLKEANGLTGSAVGELLGKGSADLEGAQFKATAPGKDRRDRKGPPRKKDKNRSRNKGRGGRGGRAPKG